jgi:histidine ammonia-lyase
MNKTFRYGIDHLTFHQAIELANGRLKGELTEEALKNIQKSYHHVQHILQGQKAVYGVNTGFGPLCNVRISAEDAVALQENILRSHSVGVGDAIADEIALLMLVSKVHALAQGFSGVNPSTVERLMWHIEHRAIPLVPKQGSVGASGDLAPLSHLCLPLIGLGKVRYKGNWMDTAELFKQTGLKPIQLSAKEGLALINGTQFIVSHGVKVVEKMLNCLETADLIGAMSLEGLQGSATPFEARLHDIRPYHGTQLVAYRLRTLLEGSEIMEDHKDCDRVQDPYSLRCMPPVHGASRNAWLHLRQLVEIELNSVTDNPLVFEDGETVSGGNFHGQPLAMPLDYAALAAHELGNISERRTYLLLEGKFGLPKLLMRDTGLYSGFMIPQYTAAALVSENKSLCFPASADSIPTSLGQEDHVSMGSISGRKALQIVENLEYILAVELLCAAQAMDYRRPYRSGKVLDSCHELVRAHVSHAESDRIFAEDIQQLHQLITSGLLVKTANTTASQLGVSLHGRWTEFV